MVPVHLWVNLLIMYANMVPFDLHHPHCALKMSPFHVFLHRKIHLRENLLYNKQQESSSNTWPNAVLRKKDVGGGLRAANSICPDDVKCCNILSKYCYAEGFWKYHPMEIKIKIWTIVEKKKFRSLPLLRQCLLHRLIYHVTLVIRASCLCPLWRP